MRFFGKTSIEFIGTRRYAFALSGLLILVGLISLLIRGGPQLAIDFKGGILLQISFNSKVSTEDLRSALSKAGHGKAEIQSFATGEEFLIRAPFEAAKDVSEEIKAAISEFITDKTFEVRREEAVGPKVGSELGKKAILAIVFSLAAILLYIYFRFEFRFAVAAVAALFHDVLITLGFFSLTNREISLAVIAAFLTIVGYSLNDTIVVFDRIRENMRKYHKESYFGVLNASINETLGRTIMTSFTTLIVVLSLFFLGGEVLRDFSFALLVGIITGTYSSIYVASALIAEWHLKSPARRR
ncbi:MAG: protein translocase subunit SecF [bacterium]